MLGHHPHHIQPIPPLLLLRADLGEGRPARPCYEFSFVANQHELRDMGRVGLSELEVSAVVSECNFVLWQHTARNRFLFRLPPLLLLVLSLFFIFAVGGSGENNFGRFVNAVLVLVASLVASSLLQCFLSRRDAAARGMVHAFLEGEVNPRWMQRGMAWRLTVYQSQNDGFAGEETQKVFLGLFTMPQQQQQRQQLAAAMAAALAPLPAAGGDGAAGGAAAGAPNAAWECVAVPRTPGQALPVATYFAPPGPPGQAEGGQGGGWPAPPVPPRAEQEAWRAGGGAGSGAGASAGGGGGGGARPYPGLVPPSPYETTAVRPTPLGYPKSL